MYTLKRILVHLALDYFGMDSLILLHFLALMSLGKIEWKVISCSSAETKQDLEVLAV